MKTLVLYYNGLQNQNLSYQHGWEKAFKKSNQFKCSFFNLAYLASGKREVLNIFKFQNYNGIKKIIFEKFDLIIILHSAFSNACLIPTFIQQIISSKKCFKVYFIGNEYKLMPEKINFTKKLGINLFITQSHKEEVINLYQDELKINVKHLPGGGLDDEIYYPMNLERKILIGYRTFPEPEYMGHQDRVDLYNFLKKESTIGEDIYDISIKDEDRFGYKDWAVFLNKCVSMPSVCTGSNFFFIDDDLRKEVLSFKSKGKSFKEIYDKFFKYRKQGTEWRGVTGKVVEALGTKTVNIMVDGDYGPYLKPDVHYIPLRKDFSNYKECVEKLKNKEYFSQITENGYRLSKEKFLFSVYISHLYKNILKLI